jgi:NAD(P)-dependent dehydrogenase (short-subunit alcohol dehydrogenase family)
MILSKKAAVIYGAGGAFGGAVARVFARKGAKRGPGRPRSESIDTSRGSCMRP